LLLHVALNRGELTTLFSGIAYGLTENTGIQITLPVILRDKLDDQSNTGLGNLLVFGQWHFYKQPSSLGIFTAGVRVPTRTVKRNTIETSAVASYIFDSVGIHSSDNWYAQVRGVVLTTPENRNLKPGNLFFYTLAAGPKITIKKTSLFSLLALRGVHANDSTLNKKKIPTGGDILFFGPQFGLKRKAITLGGAFGWPIMQRIEMPLPRFEWFGAFLFQVDF